MGARLRGANPRRAREIAAAGEAFARAHLHEAGVACYFWHLLSALGELQSFEPRTAGFREL